MSLLGLELSEAEDLLLRLAAASIALGVLWRVWGKPFFTGLGEFAQAFHQLVDLLTTEFNTNGGSTIKDTMVAMTSEIRASRLERRQIIDWMHQHDSSYPPGKEHEGGAGGS